MATYETEERRDAFFFVAILLVGGLLSFSLCYATAVTLLHFPGGFLGISPANWQLVNIAAGMMVAVTWLLTGLLYFATGKTKLWPAIASVLLPGLGAFCLFVFIASSIG